ncbi:MAG TPA: ABC-2 family transporter protein [Actinomycetota bacterium]|nr:ABC-2 family transporter protein [Actinomycetota bacterium]
MKAYAAALTLSARRSLENKQDLAVRVLFYVIVLGVLSALWRVALHAAGGRIGGYDYSSILWYLAASEAAVIATKPRLIEETGDDISNGSVAVEMLRPVSVAGFRMAQEAGESISLYFVSLVIGAPLVWINAGAPPALEGVLLMLPSAVLAIVCNVAAQHVFAAAAFWLDDAKATWFLYQKLVFLVGGMLLPLEMFPEWLNVVSWILPFWTMAYAPARFLSGHSDPLLLLAQGGWAVALVAGALAIFSLGEKRIQVAGG